LKLTDLAQPEAIIKYYDASRQNQSLYLGEGLFTPKKQVGMEVNMISGHAGYPVMLSPSTFDADITIRERISISRMSADLPMFRESMTINEKLCQEILKLQSGNNAADLKVYVDNIFDDMGNLVRGGRVARERMAMDVISSGKVKFTENGVPLDYDYQMKKYQFFTPKTAWSDTANAVPLEDIDRWVTAAKRHGFYLTRAVVNSNTMANLKANISIRHALYPTAVTVEGLPITKQTVIDLIKQYTGVTIAEYDEVYATIVGGIPKQFYPDDTITLLPATALGNMVFGTTPEEARLNAGVSNVSTSLTDTGVAVTSLITYPTVNVSTIVSQIVLPVLNTIGGSFCIGNVG